MSLLAQLCKTFPANGEEVFRVFANEACLWHESYEDYPEKAERLKAILQNLAQIPASKNLSIIEPREAKREELLLVHSHDYLTSLESCILSGKSRFMSEDCHISEDSWHAILAAAGLSLALADSLMQDVPAFALTRPPGHHAGRSKAEGFCFINNLAIALESIRQRDPEAKFLVIDFDVHHGNGIQSLYCEDPKVFYYSLHGSPAHIYPYSGHSEEEGHGEGTGFTRNITLPPGTNGDLWLEAFEAGLTLSSCHMQPDYILVSAGFDAHKEDPYSIMQVEDRHYLKVMQLLKSYSEEFCPGKLGLFLEGGYNTSVLGRVVAECIHELSTKNKSTKN